MFSGKNESGKMFEVINEEREVIGAFDELAGAVACGKAAHWVEGNIDIRRDAEKHASHYAESKARYAAFQREQLYAAI